MIPSTVKTTAGRLQSYKHHAKDPGELRRRRHQYNVSLRKYKRDEQIQSKRNLIAHPRSSDESDDERQRINLDQILLKAQNSDPAVRYEGVRAARKLLSNDCHPPIDDFIRLNVLPILVQCLTCDEHPDLQFEAAWALTNVASGTAQQTQAVADANAVPYLIRLLHSPQFNVCEQALWALGNLIGDGWELRNRAIESGVIEPLVDFVRKDVPVAFLRNITWVMVNLSRHKEPAVPSAAVQEMLPALKHLLTNSDTTILVDCAWALAYLLDSGTEIIQLVIDVGVIPMIIQLLSHDDSKIVTAALRAVGNVVTGTDEQTQSVLNHGVLNHLPTLLKHQKEKINKEAVWFLSNIAAGNQQQIQTLIDAHLIPDIVHHLQYSDIQIQKEAAWCISNFTMSGSMQQIQFLVSQRIIPPLCDLLQQQDVQLLQVCLDALHNLLKQIPEEHLELVTIEIEECGGLDKIESLQTHSNDEVYQQCYEMIDRFFSTDIEEGDAPSTTSQVPDHNEYPFGYHCSNQTVPDANLHSPRFHF